MKRPRDSQQSRVYAWEEKWADAEGHPKGKPDFATLEECEAFLAPIWPKERGRVGLARQRAPELARCLWGQSNATAGHDHVLKLPKWARQRWVILHEMSHRLVPNWRKDPGHGPRFVGVYIGVLARHLDWDAELGMRLAAEMGVKFHVRSIGVVPVHGPKWHVERMLRTQPPMTAMDMALHLEIIDGADIVTKQVRGAALSLIREGKARWLRNKLVPVGAEPIPPKTPPRRPGPLALLRERAAKNDIVIDSDGGGGWFVTCSRFDEDEDPLCGEHFAGTLGEVADKIKFYEAELTKAAA